VHQWWHSTHRYDIQVPASHASTWVHWYSSLLQWSMSLGQRGHVAVVGRIPGLVRRRVLCVLCTKCTCAISTDLLVWYFNTQNDFSHVAAIFSLHTLASPSGRNVNYDENLLSGKIFFWVVSSICTGFVNTCPTVFLSYIFVITEYIIKRPVYLVL
jgi:hypothetical protein